MLLEKTLILKGVAGVAAVGGVVGGGYFLKKSLERPQTKEEKLEEINKKLGDLGLGECNLVITDLTTPTVFSKDCELDKTKLEKIKFSNMGNGSVTVTGLTEGGNIKLNIANKEGNDGAIKYTFKEIKTKLTISGDSKKPNINLKANEEREFEDKGGKLGKVSNASYGEAEKTKAANAKLKTLKIPDWCRFEEEDKDQNSIECDLSNKEADLKKIDFSNKEKGADSVIDGSTTGLKLTINRLNDTDAQLKHYPKSDLEFIFSGYSSEIKIKDNRTTGGVSDIVLKLNTNPIFTMTDDSGGDGNENRLSKTLASSAISNKLGLYCSGSSPYSCRPKSTSTTIKVLNSTSDGIDEIAVGDGQDSDSIMTAQDDVEGYEQGVKFTVTTPFPSGAGASPKLEKTDYQAKYVTGKGWGLVKKSQ